MVGCSADGAVHGGISLGKPPLYSGKKGHKYPWGKREELQAWLVPGRLNSYKTWYQECQSIIPGKNRKESTVPAEVFNVPRDPLGMLYMEW